MLHTKDNVLGTLYAYLLYIFSFTIADGARDRSNSSGDETEIKPGRIRYNLRKRSLDSSSESVSGDVGDQKDTRKRRRSSSRSVAPYLKGKYVFCFKKSLKIPKG